MFKTKLLYLIMLFFLNLLLVKVETPQIIYQHTISRNAGKLFELKCQRTLLPYFLVIQLETEPTMWIMFIIKILILLPNRL
jgi:hypothetical protein